MARRIEPGWRYMLAQLFLRLLFGRKSHFISPWMMAGVGAGAVLTSPDGRRVLIQQRAGNVEGVGKWGTFGGYLNMEHQEPISHALARELLEESGLVVPAEQFTIADDYHLVYNQSKNEMWQHITVAFWYYRTVPDHFETRLQTSDEVSGYRWVTLDELDAMWTRGEIAGAKEDHYLGLRKALAAAESRRFPSLKLG